MIHHDRVIYSFMHKSLYVNPHTPMIILEHTKYGSVLKDDFCSVMDWKYIQAVTCLMSCAAWNRHQSQVLWKMDSVINGIHVTNSHGKA